MRCSVAIGLARLHRGTVVPTVIFFIHGGDRRTTIFFDLHSVPPVVDLANGLVGDTSQCVATYQSAYPGASGTIGAAILRFSAIFCIRLHEAWVAFRLQGSEFFHPDCPTSRGVVDYVPAGRATERYGALSPLWVEMLAGAERDDNN